MNEKDVLKQVSIGFEYSYRHDDWVTPMEEAVAGIDAETATRKLKADTRSIWEIVLHLAVWNENIIERIRTKSKAKPAEGNWPKLPEIQDEAAWEQAKGRLRNSLESVQSMLRDSSLSEINDGPYGLADLLCRFTHNGYHIGQITVLREVFIEAEH